MKVLSRFHRLASRVLRRLAGTADAKVVQIDPRYDAASHAVQSAMVLIRNWLSIHDQCVTPGKPLRERLRYWEILGERITFAEEVLLRHAEFLPPDEISQARETLAKYQADAHTEIAALARDPAWRRA